MIELRLPFKEPQFCTVIDTVAVIAILSRGNVILLNVNSFLFIIPSVGNIKNC